MSAFNDILLAKTSGSMAQGCVELSSLWPGSCGRVGLSSVLANILLAGPASGLEFWMSMRCHRVNPGLKSWTQDVDTLVAYMIIK